MPDRRCKTCAYRPEKDCQYPIPEWIAHVLHRVYSMALPLEVPYPQTMQDDEGEHCPTWKERQ